MKAILEFDLDDFSERLSHKRAICATDAYVAISAFSDVLRSGYKYGTFNNRDLTESEAELFSDLSDSFYDVLNRYGVDLDDLD